MNVLSSSLYPEVHFTPSYPTSLSCDINYCNVCNFLSVENSKTSLERNFATLLPCSLEAKAFYKNE